MATGIGSPSSRHDPDRGENPDHLPLAGRCRRPVRPTPPPRAEPSPPSPGRCMASADAGAAGEAAQQQQSWPGLPRGVEFNPSDSDILWHLAAEVGNGLAHRHPFITEFIIPVSDDRGFSCTHPQDIPGVRQDGRASYFFHKRFDLYNNESDKNISWQKVGTPKSIILDGTLRGCKEEFVLYAYNMGDNSPQKTDWGLHQYHIRNTLKDEGELIVLKIFHKSQNHQCEFAEKSSAESEWDISTRDDSKEEQTQEEMYVDQNKVVSSKDIVCTTGFSPIIQANDYTETDYLDHISLQERYRILLADKSSVQRNHEETTYREDICCMLQEISSAPPIVGGMDDDSSGRLLGEEISGTQISDMECFVGSNRYQRACSSRDCSELPITNLSCGSKNNQLVDVKLEPALEGYEIESSESLREKSHYCSEDFVLEGAGSIPVCLPKDSQIERLHCQGDLVDNTSEICKSASAEASSQAKNTPADGSGPSLGVKSELTESDLPGLCENSSTRMLDHDGGIGFRSHQQRKRKTTSYSTDKTLEEDAYTNVEGIAYCPRRRRRRKTATDSIEKALDEDAPGLLQILLNRGIMVEEIKLYGAEEDGEMLPDCTESNFEDLENVITNLFPKRTSLLKVSAARHEKGERAIYCSSCLISLIEQSRYLQFRDCPVEWGWCRDLQSFIFVFRSHNRIVLERPEYGYATYFFEVVQSLPIEWQIRRLVIAMKLNGCGRTALIENRRLLVGEDLTEGEARVLEEYGWIRNSGLGTMLNYRDRVVHDRWTEKCVADWRAKIGKLLMTGYSEGQTIITDVPKKIGDLLENLKDIEIDIKLEDPF